MCTQSVIVQACFVKPSSGLCEFAASSLGLKVCVHSPDEHCRDTVRIGHTPSRIAALSGSKCSYLQSLLRCASANALRLNELQHTALMYIAALTPTQFAIYRAYALYGQYRGSVQMSNEHKQSKKPQTGCSKLAILAGFTKHVCTMTDDIQFTPLVKAELIFKTIIYVQEIKCNYYFDLWTSVM